MAGIFNGGIFNNSIFNTGAAVESGPPLGGKGDDKRKSGGIFKPTGLVDRPRSRKQEIVDARVEQAREVAKEIAAEAVVDVKPQTVPLPPVATISLAEIEFEIRERLHKKIRTEEDEVILLLLMAAVAV